MNICIKSSRLWAKTSVILALCVGWCCGAQLTPQSITIGGKTVDLEEGKIPLLLGSKLDYGPLLDKYGVQLELQNTGPEISIDQVDVAVYEGSFEKNVPSNATMLDIDTTDIEKNLPRLSKDEVWPDGGIKFAIMDSSIPETVGCNPYDITVDVVSSYVLDGRAEKERDLIPLQVSPNCLSNNFPSIPALSESNTTTSPDVTIEFASDYMQTTNSVMGFVIRFGGRLMEGNPLNLVNITGTSRYDMLYAWEVGEIYLVAYPDNEEEDATITVMVKPGITTYDSGFPNKGSEIKVQYKPGNGAYQQAAIVLTAVFAAVLLLSLFTSFLVSSVQPWATAGSLGYGALGFALWAQRFYLSGMISTEVMPANYKTMTDVFAWANFQAPLPWNWGSQDYGLPANITENNDLIFQDGSIVILDSKDLRYVDYTTDTSLSNPPSPLPSPPPPVAQATPEAESKPEPQPQPQPEPQPQPQPQPEPQPEPQPQPEPTPVAPQTPAQTPATPIATNPAEPETPAVTPGQDSCSVFESTDFFGGDLESSKPFKGDPQECCNACLADPKCVVWTFSFVDNKCYLKGATGWVKLDDRTCCVSGTANRNGVTPIKIDQLESGKNEDNKNNNKNNEDDKNTNNNNNKGNRKLLTERVLLQIGSIGQTSGVGQENIRFRAISYNDPFSNSTTQALVVISGEDAGERAQFLVQSATQGEAGGQSSNDYDRLERAAFWFACLLAAVLLLNGSAFMLVKCCEGEVPGVLYMPRMLLMVVLFSLTGFSFASADLFSAGGGIVSTVVGIVVIVFYPALFLLASFIGIAAALYRKRKAVYLLSSRSASNADDGEVTKWDKSVISKWMGMSLNRGKWRPTDPSKKNEFVFRWGPLFEDCRGPLFQRKKVESSPNISLRHVHSAASDHSSQSGANTISESGMMMPRRSSSRKKVTSVEEKPMCHCCGSNWRRSNYQAYGTIVSFSRMCIYGVLIGALGDWPAAQAGSCLGISVLYLCYLRFAVPYSRRDEMALEYWVAFLDIAIFGILLGLVVGIGKEDFSSMDTFCIVLIVIQGLGMLSYLINRVLIIIHAFSEVVCPACKCGAPSPRKSKRRRRSRSSVSRSESLAYSASDTSTSQQMYTDGKGQYFVNGSQIDGRDLDSVSGKSDPLGYENGSYVPPKQPQNMTPDSRSASRSKSGMFPAIIEEPVLPEGGKAAPQHEDEVDLSQGLESKKGQNAVFDKFWRSL